MKSVIVALAVLCIPGLLDAWQAPATGPSGRWEIDETPWAIVLELNGSTLTGKVIAGQENEIYDGKVDGNVVTFRAKSFDGDRVITFVGRIDGDAIRFTRQVEIREGGVQGGNALMGGVNGPTEFVARRASGPSWTGTIRNAPNPRNPNPNPNVQQVTIATRKMPDPYWRWRGGEKELTFRTFNLPNASFQLNAFDVVGDRLTYSYSQPNNGIEVTCTLVRQPEGPFAGLCRQETGNVLGLIELTPSDSSGSIRN